jgi:hypothetical protein
MLRLKSIIKNLVMLYQEKKMFIDMGLATDNVDEQIRKLLQNAAQSEHIIVALCIYLLFILSQFQVILQRRRHNIELRLA